MQGKIDFKYDRYHDIVIATPHWVIESAVDVSQWYAQYSTYMQRYGRPMDIVLVLDHFDVKPAIGVAWGVARAKFLQSFTRFNYRVHASKYVRLFVNTSGVRYNAATQEAATVADAIEGILAARREANLPAKGLGQSQFPPAPAAKRAREPR